MLRLTTLCLLFAGLAAADVQGGIVRSGGQPIPGAAVTADCGTDKISTVTDFDGRFEMGGLPSTPCKFSVAMFGFQAKQLEAKASSTAMTFDLTLQAKATLPPADLALAAAATPKPAAGTSTAASTTTPTPVSPAATAAATKPATTSPTTSANAQQRGRGRGTQGGAAAQGTAANGGGFQNLSLLQSGTTQTDSDVAPGGGFDTATLGSNDAMQINGSIVRM